MEEHDLKRKMEPKLSIEPSNFSPNEAWLLFQLNDRPIRTEADGNFNALAVMEVASGMIFGMELVPAGEAELPEFSARKLLASAEDQAGARPECLFIASEHAADGIVKQATAMGITVRREPGKALAAITREAREGFAAHVGGERSL